jgi:hypothetical protein
MDGSLPGGWWRRLWAGSLFTARRDTLLLIMKDRVQKLPSLSGIELHITAKKEWGSLVFLPVWLVGWTFGGVMAIKWVLHPGPSTPRAFISLWLLGWGLGEGWAIYQWLWTAFGKEIVQIKDGDLTINRDILGRGRSRSFPIGTVTNLRASGVFPSSSYCSNYLALIRLGGGTVGFDSQSRTQRFGIQLTEPEAQHVVQELKPNLPRFAGA